MKCAASLLLIVWLTSAAAAQELALLRHIPSDALHYTGGARPDAHGMVAYNRDGFKSPEFQRGAMHYLIIAVVRNDEQAVASAWRAIDATFDRQQPEGGFSRPGAPCGGPSAAAFWLSSVSEAVLVLRESPLEPKFRERIAQVIPKIHKAARWLAQPRYQKRLAEEDADAPNRLLFDALAFGLSGVLTDDAELQRIGRRFVDLAMTRYRPDDGVFLERGGSDSSYQAVAALKLQVWTLYFPDKKLSEAVDRAVRWERDRVGPDGQVDVSGNTRTGLGQERWMGHDKSVNLSEVTFCLLWHAAATGDQQSLAAARRIQQHRQQIERKPMSP
ncbi:MAG: hypothetical protein ABFC88_10280 [Thermoguttaceae bacterium]